MITVRRPLLVYGGKRPSRLRRRQLQFVRTFSTGCFMLIGILVACLYWLELMRPAMIGLRISLLLLAAAPAILLEYYLKLNTTNGVAASAAQSTTTLYITEILQWLFVLNLGVFLFEHM